MAYTLISLVQIQEHHLVLDPSSCKPQIISLFNEARILQELVEEFHVSSIGIQHLEILIREAAHEAEDIIESYVMDQSLQLHLSGVMAKFEHIKYQMLTTVLNFDEINTAVKGERKLPSPQIKLGTLVKKNTNQYDYDYSFIDGNVGTSSLAKRLFGGTPSKLQFIPITRLNLDTLVSREKERFYARQFDDVAWVDIKQRYNIRHTLLALLASLEKLTEEVRQKSSYDLGEYLTRCLRNKRYFIIVEILETGALEDKVNDYLETEAWGNLQRFFPDSKNGSRIVILSPRGWKSSYAESSFDLQAILLMMYDHLPSHLKPCFLYTSAFPFEVDIQSSRIIKLWIAEGFVEPSDCSLEESAKLYLEDLIRVELLRVSCRDLDGNVKAFKVSYEVNRFCQKKAAEENFLWFNNSWDHQKRRVSFDPLSESVNNTIFMSLARSFLCVGSVSIRLALSFRNMRLLRVLDVLQLEFYRFPQEMMQLVLLRFLAFSCHSDLPSAISKFLNLQTLIIRRLPSSRAFTLPPGFWELTQLRHIISKETCVWYLPSDGGKDVLQENLQTLSNIHVFLLTDVFVKRIPNLTKLGMFCDSSLNTVIGLDCLHKLETLKCSASWSSVTQDFLSYLKCPASLKKLTLRFCKIPLEFMARIGSLPNLEQLKLYNSDFLPRESQSKSIEPEWVLAEGEFVRLRSLHMKELNLVHWRVHDNSFPSLEVLVIQDCCLMKEIPHVLRHIERRGLNEANRSVLATTNQMKVERSLQYEFTGANISLWKNVLLECFKGEQILDVTKVGSVDHKLKKLENFAVSTDIKQKNRSLSGLNFDTM